MRAAILAALLFGCARTKPEEANKAAAEYVKKVPDATGFECAEYDSDDDGYCSCTVFRAAGHGPLSIECGCERFCIWNCARGCKYSPFAGGKGARVK